MTDECNRSTDVKIARLEERLQARDTALLLATETLKAWQASSNEWRQENVDQRAQYMTTDKANALIAVESNQRYSLDSRVRILEDAYKIESGKHSAFSTTWVVVAFLVTNAIGIVILLLRK